MKCDCGVGAISGGANKKKKIVVVLSCGILPTGSDFREKER
jgi:hypothetical protein